MFEPGDQVERVAAVPEGTPSGMKIGGVYTVTWFVPAGMRKPDGRISRTHNDAIGLARLPDMVGTKCGWVAKDFRLLKRRDPDLIRKLMTEPVQENA